MDVIVVEDSDDDARITMRGLHKVQPQPSVELIVDGASAIEQLTRDTSVHPRLVFLDLKLPKVHGLEVLEAMRSTPECKDTPVVVLTSSDEPRDVNRARELGCSEYLTKPVDWSEYVDLVCTTAARFLGTKCAV